MERYKFPKGHTINKGKTLASEHREKVIKSLVPYYFPTGHVMNVGKVCSPETKEKIRKSLIGKPRSEKTRKANSKAGKEKWQDPVYREMMIQRRKGLVAGEKHPMFGKKHTEESRRKMSEAHIGLQAGENHPLFGKHPLAETIRKMLTRRTPTSLEKKFLGIVEKNGLPYKFVGDGSFMIGRKNPDFININGLKIAVEVYARYYKLRHAETVKEWQEDRERVFKEYGWTAIFFDETQVNERNILQQLGGK